MTLGSSSFCDRRLSDTWNTIRCVSAELHELQWKGIGDKILGPANCFIKLGMESGRFSNENSKDFLRHVNAGASVESGKCFNGIMTVCYSEHGRY